MALEDSFEGIGQIGVENSVVGDSDVLFLIEKYDQVTFCVTLNYI